MCEYYVFKKLKLSRPRYKDSVVPFSFEELKNIPIYGNTYVTEAKPLNWKKASEFPELKDFIIAQHDPSYFGCELAPPSVRLNANFKSSLLYAFLVFAPILVGTYFPVINIALILIIFVLAPLWFFLINMYFIKNYNGLIGFSSSKIKIISSVDGSDYGKSREYNKINLIRFLWYAIKGKGILLWAWSAPGYEEHELDENTKSFTVFKKKQENI